MSPWWGPSTKDQSQRGTPVVVKIVATPEDDVCNGIPVNTSKSRGKNAKQLTWVLLLQAHKAAGHLSSFANAVKRRVKTRRTDENDDNNMIRRRFNAVIKICWILSVALFLVELVAYLKGWNFGPERWQILNIVANGSGGLRDGLEWVYGKWVWVRVGYVGPLLKWLANVCIVMFMIQSLDRFVLCLGCFWIRFRKIKPVVSSGRGGQVDLEDAGGDDGDGFYPMVLVQIPMCNEREVYEQSIGAVCGLDWPKSKLLVQILDDSDDPTTEMLIREEVKKWENEGTNIVYRHREIRKGYKAGNLKSGMSCSYVQDYEFVAIFDADFQPTPDFLKRTLIHFKDKEEVGLVQARWSFVNKDENLLTRLQNINLAFHFEVEQQVNGIFLNFFGFNGTAGVWRIKALEESGGWLERTTVEDMDIAVRAHLKGWKFVFLNDVECQCELPESYETYRKQQHRWHSGPMQLFRLCLPDILKSEICFQKKANLIFLFFLLRKLILPFYSFTLFCIILPMTMFVPEAELPAWVVCYIPAIMSFLNILPAPKSIPFIVPYLLFENTMSVTKFNAMISGLFQLGSAYEWVVTKKSGRSSEDDRELWKPEKVSKKKKKHNRIYMKELSLAFLLLTAAARSLLTAQGIHFYFLLFQGISFLLVGLDLIGEQIDS